MSAGVAGLDPGDGRAREPKPQRRRRGCRGTAPAVLALMVSLPWLAVLLPLPHADALGDARAERYLPPGSRLWCVSEAGGERRCAETRQALAGTLEPEGAVGAPPRAVRHWLGTDLFGRDVLSRLLAAARLSMRAALVALLALLAMGTAAGLAAALLPFLDRTLSFLSDLLLSVPRLFLILLAAAFLRLPPGGLALLIAATSWMGVARMVRAEARSLMRREFVPAARASGAEAWRLAVSHLFPHLRGTVLAAAVLRVPDLLLLDAALGFLGLGAPPPTATLGGLMSGSGGSVHEAWWLGLFPGLWVIGLALGFASVAERLRGRFEPEEGALL